MEPPSQNPAYVPVPLHGEIAAGPQNLTERLIGDTWALPIGDTWELPKELVGDGTLFRLRIAASHQQGVCLLDQGDPLLLIDAGQRDEFEHSQGPCRSHQCTGDV